MLDMTPLYEECKSIWKNVERYYKYNNIEINLSRDDYIRIICKKLNITKAKYYNVLTEYYNKYKKDNA